MQFEVGNIYRHARSMDVDIMVREVIQVDERGTKLSVFWISKQSRRFIANDEILIVPEQYPNWTQVRE